MLDCLLVSLNSLRFYLTDSVVANDLESLDEVFWSSALACEFRLHQSGRRLSFLNLAHLHTDEWVVELWVQILLLALENELFGIEELNLLCGHCCDLTDIFLDEMIPFFDQYLWLQLRAVSLRRCV